MRTHGFRVGPGSNLHEPQTPGALLAPSKPSYRRRLDDAMMAVFERACTSNNLDAAADVLELLEKWHERRSARYGRERRIDDEQLKVVRAELKRLAATRTV